VPIQRHPSPIRANFTILRNSTLEDTRLSWEARGMLAYLLSKPDNWVISTKHLITQSPKARKAAVLSILKELKDNGYLIEIQGRDAETGSFEQVNRIVFDTPNDIIPDEPATQLAGSGSAGSGSPASGQLHCIVSTDLEQELIRTSTDLSTYPIPAEMGGACDDDAEIKPSPKAKPYLREFEELWALYPRKAGKGKAYEKLVARIRAGVDVAEIKQAVINYAKVREGEEMTYTLHASTFWGPGERWKDYLDGDEISKKPAKGKPKGFSGIEEFLRNGQ